jgi:hypothetical protein
MTGIPCVRGIFTEGIIDGNFRRGTFAREIDERNIPRGIFGRLFLEGGFGLILHSTYYLLFHSKCSYYHFNFTFHSHHAIKCGMINLERVKCAIVNALLIHVIRDP